MRSSLLSLFIGLTVTSSGIFVYADNVDSVISVQKEEGLEADHDTMQIQDIEAEQKNAKEQAALQSQMAHDSKSRLENVQLKKEEKMAQAKGEITTYESRRKEAEKMNKAYTAQINSLSADMKKLDDSMAKAKQDAKESEDIATAGREELALVQEQKTKLENENRQALYAQAQAEAEVSRLQQAFAQATASLKDLEQRLQMNQAVAKKKLAMKAQLTQDLAKNQARQAQVRSALGMKPVVVVQKQTAPTPAVAAQPTDASAQQPTAAPQTVSPSASNSVTTPLTVQSNVALAPRISTVRTPTAQSESMPAGPEIQTIDKKSGKTCDVDRDNQCQ